MKIENVHKMEKYYQLYAEKNKRLEELGYPLTDHNAFEGLKNNAYCIKNDDDTDLLYFVKTEEGLGDSCKYVLSHLCVVDSTFTNSQGLADSFKEWLGRNDIEDASILVENYLEKESSLVRELSLECKHVTVRLINNEFSSNSNSSYDLPSEIEGVSVQSFEISKDEHDFVEIFNATFHELCNPISLKDAAKWVSNTTFDPSCYLFARSGSQVAGFIAIKVDRGKKDENCFSYLQEVGVRDEYKNKGIGNLLLDHGFRAASRAGSNRMGVGVVEENARAMLFFKKHGFVEAYKKSYWKL